MPKRALYNADERSPSINMNLSENMTPNRGGIHPALLKITPKSVIRETNKPTSVAHVEEASRKSQAVSVSDQEDSASESEIPYFSAFAQKLPYTKDEDELIVKYVLKGQNIFKVTSLSLWRELEAKKDNPKRTFQSLKNRFLRNIKPHLFSKFRYLIKDKTTTDRILNKFPELRHKMGQKETLSGIKLPKRILQARIDDEDAVSSTSTNESQGKERRATDLPSPPNDTSTPVHCSERRVQVVQFYQNPINFHSCRNVVYERTVKANSDGINVFVNLKSKKYIKPSSLGIYETFEKLKRKNKFSFCSTCGRYNPPKKIKPYKFSKETDSIIPCSIDTPKTSSAKSSKMKKVRTLRLTNEKQRKDSNSVDRSPCSPSLLSGEAGEVDKCAVEENDEVVSNSVPLDEDACAGSSKAAQVPNPLTPGKKTVAAECSNKKVEAKTVTNITSNKDSSTEEETTDSDDESLCEEALEDFRDIIDYEEEWMLVKKCLRKHYKSIGLEEASQENWDSFFLETSPKFCTPTLTDYETENVESTNTQSENTEVSSLANNMKPCNRNKES